MKKLSSKIMSVDEKLSRLWKVMSEAMKPKPIEDFDTWCDNNIVIPSESSSQPGVWKTSTFPFWKTPMKLMTPHKHCRELTFMKGCQVAATTVMIAHTMYIPNQYPSPSMLAQATKDAAEEFSSTKWEPFVKGNPCVSRSLGSERPKGYTNTTLRKTYPGGFLVMNGINNTNFTKGKSVRYIYLDEEDSYEISSKDDGNNIEVTKKRANNYPDSIVIRGTTPKITETSTNYQAFLLGSQERYYMPCPYCNPNADITKTYFYFEHEIFKFRGDVVDDKPDEVYIECPHCNEEIHETAKHWMMDNTRAFWMSEKGSPGEPYLVDDKVEHRSFHLPSYYSPIGFLSWPEAFKDYFKYQRTKDIEDLRVYRNQIEGLPISLASDDSVNRSELLNRAKESDYGSKLVQVPKKGLMLTMGVDVQKGYLAAEVLATGLDGETWSVDYMEVHGITSTLGDRQGLDENNKPTAWKKLAEIIIRKRYRHESGCNMPIEQTFIDAGNWTDVVHPFCLAHEKYRVFPCIGRAGWDEGKVIAPTKRHKKYKTKMYIIKKDPMILELYEKLNVLNKGARYQHFPNLPQYNIRYFKGLTAERQVVRNSGGTKKLGWEKVYERNEPIDVRCYAWAAQLASQEHLSIRSQRDYPLPQSQITFWEKPKDPVLRRQVDNPKEAIKYMPQRRKRKSTGLRAKTLSKGVN